MKKWTRYLAMIIVLVGCVPAGTILEAQRQADQQNVDNQSNFQTETPESPLEETSTQRPLRENITPDPAGQILDNTDWRLMHAVIEGELRELNYYEYMTIRFRPDRVLLHDDCNPMTYENKSGLPSYVATEMGDFIFPYGELLEDGRYGTMVTSTMLYCFHMDEETGEKRQSGIPEFMPEFEEITAYELREDQLFLYYPEDRRNILVFRPLPEIPRPTQTLAPTQTIMPTQMPGPIPGLSTPVSAYPFPLRPSPSPETAYPPPSSPYP